MKTYLTFIALKIIEIATLVFVPYGAGRLFCWATKSSPIHLFAMWGIGLVIALVVFTIGLVLYTLVFLVLPDIIELNWHWAKKLTRRDDE